MISVMHETWHDTYISDQSKRLPRTEHMINLKPSSGRLMKPRPVLFMLKESTRHPKLRPSSTSTEIQESYSVIVSFRESVVTHHFVYRWRVFHRVPTRQPHPRIKIAQNNQLVFTWDRIQHLSQLLVKSFLLLIRATKRWRVTRYNTKITPLYTQSDT